MRGYLLDTNILSYWFDPKCPQHFQVEQRITSLDSETPLKISAISLGEIEYGHRCVADENTPIQDKFCQFIKSRFPNALTIGASTSIYYGQIRARLFAKFAPKDRKKSLRPCQLIDPVSATNLGIQENDLWIAAQASEYNLTLASHDRMARIREAASDLVDFEDWVQ